MHIYISCMYSIVYLLSLIQYKYVFNVRLSPPPFHPYIHTHTHTNTQVLKLSGNEIKKAGAMVVVESMVAKKELECLELNGGWGCGGSGGVVAVVVWWCGCG